MSQLRTQLRFDDLDALKKRVGEEFSPFGDPVTVSQEMINEFATLTHDSQWIHVDVERARLQSPFKTTIAHGFLVLSLLPKLRVRPDFEIVGFGNVTNYGSDKLRFLSPVPAGSAVHARCRLLAAEAKPKGTLCTEEVEVSVVGQPRPALSYLMLMLYQPAA